jgi:hypothetical protein
MLIYSITCLGVFVLACAPCLVANDCLIKINGLFIFVSLAVCNMGLGLPIDMFLLMLFRWSYTPLLLAWFLCHGMTTATSPQSLAENFRLEPNQHRHGSCHSSHLGYILW